MFLTCATCSFLVRYRPQRMWVAQVLHLRSHLSRRWLLALVKETLPEMHRVSPALAEAIFPRTSVMVMVCRVLIIRITHRHRITTMLSVRCMAVTTRTLRRWAQPTVSRPMATLPTQRTRAWRLATMFTLCGPEVLAAGSGIGGNTGGSMHALGAWSSGANVGLGTATNSLTWTADPGSGAWH